MKSFGEFFSSLLNLNMFLRTDSKSSKDSLDETQHDKEEVQETKSEKSEETKSEKSEEKKETEEEEKNETFEFIEVAESSFEEDVEHIFITNF